MGKEYTLFEILSADDQNPATHDELPEAHKRLVVLASGSGSNLQAILDACHAGALPARVQAVFSDNPDAYALQRAHQCGVVSHVLPWKSYKLAGKTRREYDADLAAQIESYEPYLVILAGWMRLLTSAFLSRFPGRVINLHPALPGSFPGTHAIERAFEAYHQGQVQHTGVMVHLVPDEGVDNGPLIAQEIVPIYPSDTLEELTQRVHSVEHRLIVVAIRKTLNETMN